jgi:hypothetical protein
MAMAAKVRKRGDVGAKCMGRAKSMSAEGSGNARRAASVTGCPLNPAAQGEVSSWNAFNQTAGDYAKTGICEETAPAACDEAIEAS